MKRSLIIFGLIFTLSTILIVCSDSGVNDNSSTRTYIGTQTPGDVWSWELTTSGGSGTFTAVNETLGYEYSGTVSTLPNRFLELIVTSSTEPGFTAPAEAYALEYPDTVLLVKPAGSGSDVIACVALGTCPTEDATYNWVDLLEEDWDVTTDEAYGVTTSSVSGSDFTFTHTKYDLYGTELGSPVTETGFSCSGGEITRAGDDLVIAITPSGVFVGDNGPGEGGIVGMQAPASNIDLSDVLLSGREYRGITFEDGSSSSDPTKPIWARPDGSGNLIGGEYEDPFEDGIEKTDHATITFGSQASAGVVTATLTDSGSSTSKPMVFMINRIRSKYFIYGASLGGDGHGANFLAIEQ